LGVADANFAAAKKGAAGADADVVKETEDECSVRYLFFRKDTQEVVDGSSGSSDSVSSEHAEKPRAAHSTKKTCKFCRWDESCQNLSDPTGVRLVQFPWKSVEILMRENCEAFIRHQLGTRSKEDVVLRLQEPVERTKLVCGFAVIWP